MDKDDWREVLGEIEDRRHRRLLQGISCGLLAWFVAPALGVLIFIGLVYLGGQLGIPGCRPQSVPAVPSTDKDGRPHAVPDTKKD
jgi:hypothetical protein